MTWDEYYEKRWNTSTRVAYLSELETFGPSEEVAEVIISISFDDKKEATRLLGRALDAGVTFTGEQIAEMYLCCEEGELERAVLCSAGGFEEQDLEELWSFCDEDLVVEIAEKWKLRLPEGLRGIYEEEEEISEDEEVEGEEEIPLMSAEELREACDYVLECLYEAHERMKVAYKLSIVDMNSHGRYVSGLKYACLMEAEPFIDDARFALEEIESQVQDKIGIHNIRLNMGKMLVFDDVWGDGVLADWIAQRQIRKMMDAVEKVYKEVQRLRKGFGRL